MDTAVCKIREEMKTLEKYEKADPVGTAYSRSYGYIITGEESKAREIIREMVRNYPDHQLTYQAMDSYFYNVYAGKIESPAGAREIDSLMVKTVTRFPNKRFSRLYLNSNDPKSLSLQTIENICQSWMQDEPDNPLAIMRLVDRYQKEQIKPDLVLNLCDKGIDLIVDNKLRKYFDFKGVFNRRYLAYLNTVKASVLMGLGKYAEALYCIETANGFQPASHSQFLLEGKIWMALQNYSEAETAFLEALKLGNSEAETNLQKVFAIRNKSKMSFVEYLEGKLGASGSTAKSAKPQAKDFSLTTINGKKLTLASLKGKIVVLNFWNLGCGPCRAEMPELNKLVEKYTGQNVVFIVISNDQKGKIQKFLEQKEFKYIQVADANVLFKDYEVKVLPTHIIINRDGSVYNRMIGGGKDIFELLDNQIRLLTSL